MSSAPKHITVGDDCENCVYCEKSGKNAVRCAARNRTYYIGQYVPCEDKKEKN